MSIYNLISFLGIFVLMGIAWAFSAHRRLFNWRAAVWGTVLQLALGAFIFFFPPGARLFTALSDGVVQVLGAAAEGVRFCFGPLATPPGQEGSVGFILAIQGLSTAVFFAALMQVLYFIGLMPRLVKVFANVFSRLMRVSGAEALCAASNIFVGVESSTTVLPHLAKMTRSELCTILTAGMATVASTVLGLYVVMLQQDFPNIAGHLISASLLSAPAALVMSKLLLPETEQPETLGVKVEPHYERESSIMEAAMNGANAGGKLALGITAMLLAFLGLLGVINLALGGVGYQVAQMTGVTGLSFRLESILAYPFVPLAAIIGVQPSDMVEVGRLLGERAILTEVPAYQHLGTLLSSGAIHPRSAVIAAYGLCGFAHIASIAIFVGGAAALAPSRTKDLSAVAFRALGAATLACLQTAAIAGVFFTDHMSVLFHR